LAKWNSTAFLFDPRRIEPPCLGIVFHNIAIGKQIFTEWRQYLGEVDKFEELLNSDNRRGDYWERAWLLAVPIE
jgi:hypothetical protein